MQTITLSISDQALKKVRSYCTLNAMGDNLNPASIVCGLIIDAIEANKPECEIMTHKEKEVISEDNTQTFEK